MPAPPQVAKQLPDMHLVPTPHATGGCARMQLSMSSTHEIIDSPSVLHAVPEVHSSHVHTPAEQPPGPHPRVSTQVVHDVLTASC
jgi:hypothetical protein